MNTSTTVFLTPATKMAVRPVRGHGSYVVNAVGDCNNLSLHFDDLAHVESWVRDLLAKVEVAKIEAAGGAA